MRLHFFWWARVCELVFVVDNPEVVYDGAPLVVRYLLYLQVGAVVSV